MASAAALACAALATARLLHLFAARRGATVPEKPDRCGARTPAGAGADSLPESIMVASSPSAASTRPHQTGQQGGESEIGLWLLRFRHMRSMQFPGSFRRAAFASSLEPEVVVVLSEVRGWVQASERLYRLMRGPMG